MAWLRLDDTFDTHPKIVALGTDERRWTWMRVLLYASRHRSPIVPAGIRDVIGKATPAFLRDCVKLGLLDDEHGVLTVHDFEDYNGRDAIEREQARIRKQRQRSRESHGADRDTDRDETVTRAQARARVPSPTPVEPSAADVYEHADGAANGAAAAGIETLRQAGWTDRQLTAALTDLPRATALLQRAHADPTCRAPGALAWTQYEAGANPDHLDRAPVAAGATGTRSTRAPFDFAAAAARLVAGNAWDEATSADAIREDLERVAGRHGVHVEPEQLDAILDAWRAEYARRYPDPDPEPAPKGAKR